MARAYPRALFYPLHITKASADRIGKETDDVMEDLGLEKLTALTFDPTAEAFAEVDAVGKTGND